jgi:chitodextrinase
LPVSLLFFEDAPLRGAQVNYDLQDFVHEPVPYVHMDSKGNFNSCAFQQLVRASKLSDLAGRGEGGNFSAFFDLGQEIRFYGPGVCDMRSGTHCVCLPGPAISAINGDGYPHAPGLRTVAHSCGALDEPNTCYGNEWDRDGNGVNVCPHPPELPWVPQAGDSAIKVKFVGPIPDRELRFRAEDLVPGGRQAGDLATVVGSFDWLLKIEQHGAGTFMPTWGAFGVEGDAHACAVDECVASEHNATHVRGRPEAVALLLQELGQSLGGAPSSAALMTSAESLVGDPGVALKIEAQPASDSATPVSYVWDMGDGTTLSGASVSHVYAQAGTYTVTARAVSADGNSQTMLMQAQIGSRGNAAPIVAVGGPYTIGVDQPLTLAGKASDPDGLITRTFWNFADGTFGEGTQATHTYSEAGTYTVFFSATDQRGASTVVSTTVTVE